ncbi:MAG: hypothetical protein GX790_02470 [Syntrophomonadaceae bacterium]|nr:hypothetical protein [Syntrophomonadaceae bacterium]
MNIFDDILFADLSSYNLLDPTSALGEIETNQFISLDNKQSEITEVESADNVSVKPNIITEDQKAVFQFMELFFSNGIIWETDLEDFIPNPIVEKSFYLEAVNSREQITNDKSLEEVLAEFDSWAGTPLDILSPYGDVDFGNNIFTDDFEMEVPVKIYSEDDDLVFKVDAPWIKIDSFNDVVYPSKLNLKSVLSVLPVTINSKQLKASFVNGEFKLEVPKKEIVFGSLSSKNG